MTCHILVAHMHWFVGAFRKNVYYMVHTEISSSNSRTFPGISRTDNCFSRTRLVRNMSYKTHCKCTNVYKSEHYTKQLVNCRVKTYINGNYIWCAMSRAFQLFLFPFFSQTCLYMKNWMRGRSGWRWTFYHIIVTGTWFQINAKCWRQPGLTIANPSI